MSSLELFRTGFYQAAGWCAAAGMAIALVQIGVHLYDRFDEWWNGS